MNTATKIRRCAGDAAQPHPERDAALLAMGRAASRAAENGIPFVRKIRLCAADPDNDGSAAMAKALGDAESALGELRAATRPAPANRPRASAAPVGRRPERVSPPASTQTPAPGPVPAAAPAWAYRIGDHVQFQHGRVRGGGRIVASGRAGVTVQDRDGNHHQVRLEHVLPPPPKPTFAGPSQAERLGGWHAAEALAFYDFRDRIAGDIRKKRVTPEPEAIMDKAVGTYGLGQSDAAEWTERFMASIGRDLERRAA